MSDRHSVIVLDNDENEVPDLGPDLDVRVVSPSPTEIQAAQNGFAEAGLILIDHEIRADDLDLSDTIADGASFVSHLRSWARRRKLNLPPIVMFTNFEGAFANEVPAVGPAIPAGDFPGREHRLAPVLDVEWILSKQDGGVRRKVHALAEAFAAARSGTTGDGASLADISAILAMPSDRSWSSGALDDVARSRPPVSERPGSPGEPARGPAQVVRWLCHRVLPYPGLLLSDAHAAWTLGVSRPTLDRLAEAAARDPSAPLLGDLHATTYRGALGNFLGRRWWRRGIDAVAFELDEAPGGRAEALLRLDLGIAQADLLPPSTVVAWDPDLLEIGPVPLDDAVQVMVRAWPAEALDPWMLRDDVEADPVLAAMVDPVDRRDVEVDAI